MKEFKLIVAGGRDFMDYRLLFDTIFNLANNVYRDQEVSIVSGMANGADALGYRFAKQNDIVVYEFPADWNQYGKRAGFMRNEQMGDFADGLLAFWDGKSKGTKHMIDYMTKLGKDTHIYTYYPEEDTSHFPTQNY